MKKNRIHLSILSPSSDHWLGTALDSQTDSIKKYRIRLSVVNCLLLLAQNRARRPDRFSQKVQNSSISSQSSAVAGSERRLTARRIQSKSTEFVCQSSTVCCRWLGTALEGQTDSVKKYRIRLSVVNRLLSLARSQKVQNSSVRRQSFAVAGSERRSTARQIQAKNTEVVCKSSARPLPSGSERHSTARQTSEKEQS